MVTRINTVDLIKKNLTSVVSTVTVVALIAGGVLGAETRYAKAADVADLKSYVKQQHRIDRYENRHDVLMSRKQQLEDQLFMLSLKPNPNQTDKAIIQHFTDQLNGINVQLAQPAPTAPTD